LGEVDRNATRELREVERVVFEGRGRADRHASLTARRELEIRRARASHQRVVAGTGYERRRARAPADRIISAHAAPQQTTSPAGSEKGGARRPDDILKRADERERDASRHVLLLTGRA